MDFDLTRILASFLVGALLSQSGSLCQLTTHNQLASPSTLGFDGLAVAAVLSAYIFNCKFLGTEWMSLIIFSCGFVLLLFYSQRSEKSAKQTFYRPGLDQGMKSFILLGLCFNLFMGAIYAFMQFMFMAYQREFPHSVWFGHFKFLNVESLYFLLVFFVMINWQLLRLSPKLAILSLGDEFSYFLSREKQHWQKKALLLSLVITVVVISFFGVFSFMALLLPNFLRNFTYFSKKPAREITVGSWFAGIFFSILDWLCYQFPMAGSEIPVGVLSAILGSLMLIFIVMQRAKKTRSSLAY